MFEAPWSHQLSHIARFLLCIAIYSHLYRHLSLYRHLLRMTTISWLFLDQHLNWFLHLLVSFRYQLDDDFMKACLEYSTFLTGSLSHLSEAELVSPKIHLFIKKIASLCISGLMCMVEFHCNGFVCETRRASISLMDFLLTTHRQIIDHR